MGNNEDDEDVRSTLQWKLKKLPTGDEVAKLVEQGIISKEEARTILFQQVNQNEKVKALEEQVEFLRGVVKDLSKLAGAQPTIGRLSPHNKYTIKSSLQKSLVIKPLII